MCLFMYTQLFSQEVFVDTSKLSLGQITLSNKYCKQIKRNASLCKSQELNYIDYDETDLPSFLHGLKKHLEPIVNAYRHNDLKSSILSDIKDFNADISGDWYDNSHIELFAKTPNTYTLSTTTNGYSGGAHGYYAVHFENYSVETQKALKLDDIFLKDYNQTLIKIAETHYRHTYGLTPKQSLENDGWFENKFVLAENIAITPQGLYFHYNSYEIKSYAAGQTEFLLPYNKLHKIIDPKGTLGFVLQHQENFHTAFYDKEKASITLDTHINPDKTITLTAIITNLSYLDKGWFSLSFPQLKNTQNIIKKEYKGFESLHLYPKGSKVYNQEYKKAVRSHYLLVEAETSKWRYDDNHTITLLLKALPQQKELIVDIRTAFKSSDKTITIPNGYEGTKGQQGYHNYRVFIGL